MRKAAEGAVFKILFDNCASSFFARRIDFGLMKFIRKLMTIKFKELRKLDKLII
jgi:hypothetical protein